MAFFLLEIWIVIPVYNEENIIKDTLDKITSFLDKKSNDYEIIVVEDGSTDRTVDVVKTWGNPKLRLLSTAVNKGKGYAVKNGLLAAEKNWIFYIDADLSTSIEELASFLTFAAHYDVLISSRALPDSNVVIHQPWWREKGGKALNWFIRLLTLRGVKDTQCGFKLFKKTAACEIFSKQTIQGFGFDVEVLYIARKYVYKIKELPITWYNREATRVRPFQDGLKIMADVIRIRLNDLRGLY